jgi:hypothetical protein
MWQSKYCMRKYLPASRYQELPQRPEPTTDKQRKIGVDGKNRRNKIAVNVFTALLWPGWRGRDINGMGSREEGRGGPYNFLRAGKLPLIPHSIGKVPFSWLLERFLSQTSSVSEHGRQNSRPASRQPIKCNLSQANAYISEETNP